ncbi:helix-turn-helix domain-containing protein [Sphingobacterium thalpophilum]|uniref:Helix-turn-helix domain-containing protein n=1 Tax=Sphingobacterium thalpophilum TaxID=259 RepID=A0ABV4HCK6_9SPHI
MDAKTQQLLNQLDQKMDLVLQSQETIFQKHLLKLAGTYKTILTQEEAADYLGYQPSYLNQLTHHGKLKFIKKEGIKSKYFLRTDLDEYMSGESTLNKSESDLFEQEIFDSWNKKDSKRK